MRESGGYELCLDEGMEKELTQLRSSKWFNILISSTYAEDHEIEKSLPNYGI